MGNVGAYDSGYLNSGQNLVELTVGSYTLEFKEIAGWIKPANEVVEILPDVQLSEDAVFSPETGDIVVTILPNEANFSGAQWKLTGTSFAFDSGFINSGEILEGIRVGDYLVEYKGISSWITPDSEPIEIVGGIVNTTSSEYIPITGNLSVSLTPFGLLPTDARWQIVDKFTGFKSEFLNSDALLEDLLIGTYDLIFMPVPCWKTPISQVVTVEDGITTQAIGEYMVDEGEITVTIGPEEAVNLGAQWKILNASNSYDSGLLNSGSQIQDLCVDNYVLELTPVTGFVFTGEKIVKITGDAPLDLNANYMMDDDEDKMPDAWEIEFFFDTTRTPNEDFDSDGFSNLQEFKRNSDPTEYTIELKTGWNLVSLARLPLDNRVSSIFAGVDISSNVWAWTGDRMDIDTHLDSLKGYWIFLKGPKSNISINVPQN